MSREEVFGPVTCVYGYDQLDDAIGSANSLPVAFQASVFANDIDVALHAADRLDASAVMINDHTAFRTDWMPFAGRRESGLRGRRHSLQHARDDAGKDARVPLSRVAGAMILVGQYDSPYVRRVAISLNWPGCNSAQYCFRFRRCRRDAAH